MDGPALAGTGLRRAAANHPRFRVAGLVTGLLAIWVALMIALVVSGVLPPWALTVQAGVAAPLLLAGPILLYLGGRIKTGVVRRGRRRAIRGSSIQRHRRRARREQMGERDAPGGVRS